ncbi:MAG TPA: hypothetical protein DDW50_12925, partial [Firmicutes bacterium]|nr:hypothetical protein [Bacillota bacterium]
SFDAETEPAEPTLESNSPEEPNFKLFSTLLYQTIITISCLILLLTFSHSRQPWLVWVKERMHAAITSSSANTFGKITNSKLWKSMIGNVGNLVRLEAITKNQFARQNVADDMDVTASLEKKQAHQVFQNSVWPVQGSIVKGYGWRYDVIRKTKNFQPGIEISALPDSTVLAVADGIITEIKHQPAQGWQIVVSHNNGWSSNYFYLGSVQVKIGQKVKAGDPIAQINRPDQEKGPILLLEIKDYDQSVDPLSLLAS